MSDVMEVYAVGSEVLLDKEIPARIAAINISGTEHKLEYQCTWWEERTRKSEWVTPQEIHRAPDRRKTLKFVGQDHRAT